MANLKAKIEIKNLTEVERKIKELESALSALRLQLYNLGRDCPEIFIILSDGD